MSITAVKKVPFFLLLLFAMLAAVASAASPARLDFPWPPRVGEPYPDLELLDHRGNPVRLSDLKGKVILVEPVGMSCPACNAFAGGDEKGGYRGVRPQRGVESIERLLAQFAGGVTIDHPGLVLVQVLFFDLRLRAPSVEDARAWAEHFGLDQERNVYVLAGTGAFLTPKTYPATYNLIPGFQLIDKSFVLRADSTGHRPRDSLFETLLPMVRKLLDE